LDSVKSLLVRGGFSDVWTASDGVEAFTTFQANSFDLVISDINMPNCDGFQLVKKIKELPGTEFLPIIFLSARTSPQHQREGFQVGVDNYICKPIERSQRPVFLEMIRSLIDKSARQKELMTASLKDNLTGLFRRDTFYSTLKQFILASSANNSSFSISILDIDHFKKVNDTYGHNVGDAILKEFAAVVKQTLRGSVDQVFRYGGEEFVIVLANVNSSTATTVLERIRTKVKETTFTQNLPITFSAGIYEIVRGDHDAIEQYVENADKALYEAKRSGRDCIKVFGSTSEESDKEAS
jgi:diguanylate cyclase (GGDEF)-like protein